MKITDLRCAVIVRHPIVRIVTDEGRYGLGEVEFTKTYLKPWVLHFRDALIGEDPTDVERVMLKIRQRGSFKPHGAAVSAIEHALWDIAGKVANLPIHRMLGSFRDSIPAYASSAVLPSKEAYAEEAIRIKESGLHAYKMHPPTIWQQDIEVCRHVRAAVGDGYRLMLDSTWSYNYVEALRVGRALEELNFYWFEDPLDADDIFELTWHPAMTHPLPAWSGWRFQATDGHHALVFDVKEGTDGRPWHLLRTWDYTVSAATRS